MFTGIVEALGSVVEVTSQNPGRRLTVRVGLAAEETKVGDSVAVNGCCLTAVAVERDVLAFEAGPETLSRTNLGDLAAGGVVNLERALRLGDRISGHLVTGHVDAVGTLADRRDEGDWSTCWFHMPRALSSQMASKGSVAIDGVSLTLIDVEAERFGVQLIPHTLASTTLGRLAVGGRVNLETDLLAKYVEAALGGRTGRGSYNR